MASIHPCRVDIYAKAKVSARYVRLDNDKGKSLRMMLERELQSNAPIVQLATSNN